MAVAKAACAVLHCITCRLRSPGYAYAAIAADAYGHYFLNESAIHTK
ncbi:MAG: hypothetical protein ACLRI8_10075 [Agathobacter rectalis]